MNKSCFRQKIKESPIIVTAGSSYLDIDAYACMVAMKELLVLQDIESVACSRAVSNYSVCRFLMGEGQIMFEIPAEIEENARYIIVDVSDPDFIKDGAPLDRVIEVYDHHVGFEEYWTSRIGHGAHIEFIGAAATLIYREWEKAGLADKMSHSTARLLMAAILDNTLDLTSSNTTHEDREVFSALCQHAGVDATDFRSTYFSKVQANVEADLYNALKNDLKYIGKNTALPDYMAQLCVWDAEGMLQRLSDIRLWLDDITGGSWMMNLIDIKHRSSYFVCDGSDCHAQIERIFGVKFKEGIAISAQPYLRKQIIKNILSSK